MQYLMSIDAGTGSARAVIFDSHANEIAIAQQEWLHVEEENVANSMSFDYTKNWQIIVKCIKASIHKAGIKASDIVAITASSMREGIVCYDKNRDEVFAVANVDARASNEVKYINEHYPELEKEFYALSGQTFALGALPRLMWLKNNKPSVYENVVHVNMISDWVLTKLSGEIAAEPSNAGTSGVFSLEKRDFQPFMAKKLGLKDDIFAKVYESGEVIGKVHAKASDETGLSRETLVVMGGGDVQLGSAGLGVVKEGDMAILGGTFWQQVVNIKPTKIDTNMNIRINPHVIPNLSQAEGITFFSGMVMRWFRDVFCQCEMRISKELEINAYEILEKMAMEVPVGSYGVLPIFSDVMKYAKWYHAAPSFLNLSLDPKKSSKAVLFRSLEENAAIVSNLNLEAIMKFSGVSSDTLTFAGGSSKGELWSQIVADVTNKQVKVPVVKEATSLGGAFAAGVGANIYSSIEEAASLHVKFDKVYEPNSDNYQKYQELTQQWKEAYASELSLVDRNITTSMWKAPGL